VIGITDGLTGFSFAYPIFILLLISLWHFYLLLLFLDITFTGMIYDI